MNKTLIETAHGFKAFQEAAIEAGYEGRPGRYWPLNSDLMRILRNWRGQVRLEFPTDAQLIVIKVSKKSLMEEIANNWNLSEICSMAVSIDEEKRILTLKHF